MDSFVNSNSKNDSETNIISGKERKLFYQELTTTITDKPKDSFNLVYLSFIFQGATLLMPFSTYLFLVDFYTEKFCELNLLYWAMVSVILCTSLSFAFITTIIADRVSLSKRLVTGHILFILSLSSFLLFTVLTSLGIFDSAPHAIGYVPLISGFISGIGSGIIQPSYYGLSSLLPPRYTQALVVGETASGVIIACFRVGTRLLKPAGSCESYDTVIFIALTVVFMIVSIPVLKFIYWHKYTNYWFKLVQKNFLIEYRVLDQHSTDSFDEDESVIAGRTDTLISEYTTTFGDGNVSRKFNGLKLTIQKKFIIFKKTWKLQLTILSAMIITLLLYPTFLTAAYTCGSQLCDWGPIITLCVFTLFDFITRWVILIPVKYNQCVLLLLSLTRILFIPLFAIFIFPISNPLVSFKFGFPIFQIVVAVFGVSNGFFASIPLMLIPTKLNASDKESGGIIGIFMLFIGLAVGILLSLPFYETVLVRTSNTTNLCCLSHVGNTTWSIFKNNTISMPGECTCGI
ncbi:Equilibrative nucleoside transporter 4 [Oopsacas minuta]|uniref:Equilibrative nucleoside transporter 4 n=1 Tax=Oopsacas minuta TaxID=111878 RepID=A0AAV7JDU9_9METZ|nr:Equilibrative nucleoside transporter 4 [Oopsacas minuta]